MKTEVVICSKVKRKNINSTGDYITLVVDSAKLIQDFKRDAAGVSSVQQLDVVADIEKATADDLQQIPQLFELTDSDGNTFTWGDTSHKARCLNCTRQGPSTRISFQRQSAEFEI